MRKAFRVVMQDTPKPSRSLQAFVTAAVLALGKREDAEVIASKLDEMSNPEVRHIMAALCWVAGVFGPKVQMQVDPSVLRMIEVATGKSKPSLGDGEASAKG